VSLHLCLPAGQRLSHLDRTPGVLVEARNVAHPRCGGEHDGAVIPRSLVFVPVCPRGLVFGGAKGSPVTQLHQLEVTRELSALAPGKAQFVDGLTSGQDQSVGFSAR
jgi:hypothetical protein